MSLIALAAGAIMERVRLAPASPVIDRQSQGANLPMIDRITHDALLRSGHRSANS
jgi:hypothetical protein